MFTREKLSTIRATPFHVRWVRYWKMTTKDTVSRVCGVLMGMDCYGRVYIDDVVHGEWQCADRDLLIRSTAKADRDRCDRVTIWIEQEPGSGGIDSLNSILVKLWDYTAHGDKALSAGGRESRAEPFAVQVEAGNVTLVKAAWNRDYLSHLEAFPKALNNVDTDQVDASASAFFKLTPNHTPQEKAVTSNQAMQAAMQAAITDLQQENEALKRRVLELEQRLLAFLTQPSPLMPARMPQPRTPAFPCQQPITYPPQYPAGDPVVPHWGQIMCSAGPTVLPGATVTAMRG